MKQNDKSRPQNLGFWIGLTTPNRGHHFKGAHTVRSHLPRFQRVSLKVFGPSVPWTLRGCFVGSSSLKEGSCEIDYRARTVRHQCFHQQSCNEQTHVHHAGSTHVWTTLSDSQWIVNHMFFQDPHFRWPFADVGCAFWRPGKKSGIYFAFSPLRFD